MTTYIVTISPNNPQTIVSDCPYTAFEIGYANDSTPINQKTFDIENYVIVAK
jgi:hypothetical protein